MKNLDERGNQCPIPIVHARQALKELSIGDQLSVKVSLEVQTINLKELAEEKGCLCEIKKNADNDFDVIFTVGEHKEETTCNCGCNGHSNKKYTVVVCGSEKMGCGDETLGKNLMKAFIFAVSKQDELPDAMLFYNGGVKLTTEGSDALSDLLELEKAGVTILSCGTCLDYYGLKEKLKVGKVTNMYDIVATMEMATNLLRP